MKKRDDSYDYYFWRESIHSAEKRALEKDFDRDRSIARVETDAMSKP